MVQMWSRTLLFVIHGRTVRTSIVVHGRTVRTSIVIHGRTVRTSISHLWPDRMHAYVSTTHAMHAMHANVFRNEGDNKSLLTGWCTSLGKTLTMYIKYCGVNNVHNILWS